MANVGDPSAPGGDGDGATSMDGPVLPPARTPSGPSANVAPDPESGAVVGGYELLEQLGKGGAGSVFRARKIEDGSICALKVLAASKVKRARVVQRFFDEVRAASAVQHPGLIRVLDFIEEEEPRRLAYAMEYLDGESLRDRLKRETTIRLKEAINIAAQICDALHALHEAGIIHRDLKPENIMLAAGDGQVATVKLLDFGVVKFLPIDRTGGSARETEKPGTFVGTPRYMAPEQAAGAVVDRRADLFSIGVILFEMITGRCPHEGDSLRDVVLAKLKGAPRITVNPEKEVLPQELTDLVDACLRLKPPLRPSDARAVASGLREAEMILFAVGPIRLGDDGTHVRESGENPVLEEEPPAKEPPVPPPEPVVPQPEATAAMQPPTFGAPPPNASRSFMTGALIAAGMLVAAIVIALVVRGLEEEDDAVLLVPEAPARPAPAPVPRKREVRVVTIPPGATVEVSGKRYGPTPVRVALGPDERLILTLEGHAPRVVDVPDVADVDGSLGTVTATLTRTSTSP